MVDICLVSMPFPSLERPSLALGLLSASVKKAGFSAACFYETFRFAEAIGLEAYRSIALEIMNQLGEWAFAGAAFPDLETDPEAYAALLRDRACADLVSHENVYSGASRKVDLGFLSSVRDAATRFVDESARRVLAARPRIVGCTSLFQQHAASIALLRRIEELAPDVVTVMGGTNCDGSLARVTKQMAPSVDYVVSGEADAMFSSLCRLALEHGADIPAKLLPPSVVGRSNLPSLLAETPPRDPDVERIAELDSLPVPDFADYFDQLDAYSRGDEIAPQVLFETSRGCWWYERSGGCTFCSITPQRSRFRSKSPRRALEELHALAASSPSCLFMATDDILDPKYFEEVIPHLPGGEPRPTYFFETKSNLKEEQIALLGDKGIQWLQPGIESIHDASLANMRKGVRALEHLALLKFALENGVRCVWHILYGLPGDEDRWYGEMAELAPLVAHLQPPDDAVRIRIDRFSHFFHNPSRFGLEILPHRAYGFAFPLSPERLADFAFFFEDRRDVAMGVVDGPGLSLLKTRLAEWRRSFSLDAGEAPRAKLELRDEGGTAVIADTRPGVSRGDTQLTEEEVAALAACRRPISRRLLSPDLERNVESMCERGFALRMGGRFLSLVANPPKRRMPTFADLAADAKTWRSLRQKVDH